MKTFVICFVVASVLASVSMAYDKEGMMKLVEQCRDELKIDKADLQKFKDNGFKPEDVTEPIKCHSKCMLEKVGHFKNGVFDDKAAVEEINKMENADHKGKMLAAVAKCKGEKGANECDTAFKISHCMAMEAMHK